MKKHKTEEKNIPGEENSEDQIADKLRSILGTLESQSGSRPATARNQAERLGKIRAAIHSLVSREARKLCCCQLLTVALNPDEFEAEMNRVCVLHGRRNLGHITTVTCTPPDQDDLRTLDLVLQYFQRRANLDIEYESQEM